VGRTGPVYAGFVALSTINNLHTIHQLMFETRALRTAEVGLGFEGSTLVFCASHKELGHPLAIQHTATDPFQFRAPAELWLPNGPVCSEHNPNNRWIAQFPSR
jgi:hypothetical protein